MNKMLIAVALASLATTAAAVAQPSSDRDGGARQQLRQEIREGGVDSARFVEITAERAGARFDRIDADGDGQISRAEYLAATQDRAEDRFARLDRNNDGRLTPEDRRGGHRGKQHGGPAGERTETPAN